MLILWIRKAKKDERTCLPKNDIEIFQKHDEKMKRFRLSHPKIEATNPQDIVTANGDILAAVHKVKLTKYTQN